MTRLLEAVTSGATGPIVEMDGPALLVASGSFCGGIVSVLVSLDGVEFVESGMLFRSPGPATLNFPNRYFVQATFSGTFFGNQSASVTLDSNAGEIVSVPHSAIEALEV